MYGVGIFRLLLLCPIKTLNCPADSDAPYEPYKGSHTIYL